MKTVNILSIEIADITFGEALSLVTRFMDDGHQHYIVTPNPEIVLAAKNDANLRMVLNHADLSLPDGVGLKIASRILGNPLTARTPGADFAEAIVALSEEEGWSIFVLGGRESKISEKAAWRLRYSYKNCKIVGHASGGDVYFKNGAWQTTDPDIIKKINASGAEILFVSFGCPKQEKWIFTNLDKMPKVRIAMTVGGTIDFWAGKVKRAPQWIRMSGCEWLWRLVLEPKRYKRIWRATVGFLWQVFKWRYRMHFVYRHNVVGFITNNQNQALLVQRANEKSEHWQFPQGGVNMGEDEKTAVVREMYEETGLTNMAILGKNPQTHSYQWPQWHRLNGGYKGQSQTLFYLLHPGKNDDVRIDAHEIADYEWVDFDDILQKVHERRKPIAQIALLGYASLRQQIQHEKQ